MFDTLSQAICYIAKNNYKVNNSLHLLDDFLTIDPPRADGERSMALLMMIFKRLNVPIAMHKTVGPVMCHEYLGIILDTQKMEARLPQEKIDRICDFIFKLHKRSSCTKKEILQLPGHLNFASPVILPGRSFVSYLIKLSTTVSELHHFVHLNKECRIDLEFWLRFLKNWNGINMFYSAFFISNFDMELFTDASSTLGFGGFFREKWFYSSGRASLTISLNDTYQWLFSNFTPLW